MRVDASFSQLVAGFNGLAVHNLDSGSVRDRVFLGLARLVTGNNDFTALLVVGDRYGSAELGDDRKSLRLTSLEQLLDTGKTLCDIAARDTAGVECSHGQLCAGLTDGLCRDNTYRFTYLDHFAGSHVGAVALRADSHVRSAGQDGTDLKSFDPASALVHASLEDRCSTAGSDHVILLNNDVAISILDIFADNAAGDAVSEILDHCLAVCKCLDGHAGNGFLTFAAVDLTDDKFLRYVDHSSGQVTGVRCTKRCIRQTLAGAVRRHEVLQNVQTFTEVGLDGQLDRASRRIRHQSAHACQLLDLLVAASGSGVSHHEDVVVLIKTSEQQVSELVISLCPCINDSSVSLLFCHQASDEVSGDHVYCSLRFFEHFLLLRRNGDVGNGNRHSRNCGILVSHSLDQVKYLSGLEGAVSIDDGLKDLLEVFLLDQEIDLGKQVILRLCAVHKSEVLRNDLIKEKSSEGDVDGTCDHLTVFPLLADSDLDLGVQRDVMVLVSEDRLVHAVEASSLSGLAVSLLSQIVDTEYHIL